MPYLQSQGHTVFRLARAAGAYFPQPEPNNNGVVFWDPPLMLDSARLEGFDAVVHLAGENVAQRWTEKSKAIIRDSRVKGTHLLAEQLSVLTQPPKTFIVASGVGFYGDRGSEVLTEASYAGTGFLSSVCREWEDATLPAVNKGIRTVNLRIGMVLSAKGGALAKMLLPFKMGAGGNLGNGNQYISWITMDDMVRVIAFALESQSLQGPVNCVAPNPVTNAEFTGALGKSLGRPTVLPLPAFAVRALFGQMGEELLLSGTRARPDKLEAAGFKFEHPEIGPALKHVLGKPCCNQ